LFKLALARLKISLVCKSLYENWAQNPISTTDTIFYYNKHLLKRVLYLFNSPEKRCPTLDLLKNPGASSKKLTYAFDISFGKFHL
jgi:hypothetical protein